MLLPDKCKMVSLYLPKVLQCAFTAPKVIVRVVGCEQAWGASTGAQTVKLIVGATEHVQSDSLQLLLAEDMHCRQRDILVKVHSYIAQCLVLWTTQSSVHFIPWQTCSFKRQLNFSGKHLAMLQLLHRLFLHISTTVNSEVLTQQKESNPEHLR